MTDSPDPSAAVGGTLYLVATPIGNLGDITRRAVAILSAADRIVAEDTRRTRQLLSHLGIHPKRLQCVNAHSGAKSLEQFVNALLLGESIALVTDAGMPSVSDPGTALVQLARNKGAAVVALPGASAVTTIVAVCGLVEGPFLFQGFLPRKGEKRRKLLEKLTLSAVPTVLFEAPQRLQKTLEELAELCPTRAVCVGRELTKRFEEVRVQTAAEWAAAPQDWRGEITLVLAAVPEEGAEESLDADDLERRIVGALALGRSVREVTDELLPVSGLGRRELYRRILDQKDADS